MRVLLVWFFGLALFFVANSAHAEQFVTVGKHEIHYNAFSADMVSAEAAKLHGITRSRSRALLNVTVLEVNSDGSRTPVSASVKASAKRLTGQVSTLAMRPIHEADALYYLGELRVAGNETLQFVLLVQFSDATSQETIKFSQEFFAN